MRISIEDYESRALDYVEGNLPADELPAFEAFLSEHPDLGREIRSMRGSVPVLPAEKWVYPDKKALLRGGIGVSVWLNRAGSFLGGMAAACLLIGRRAAGPGYSGRAAGSRAAAGKCFSLGLERAR